MAKNMKPTIFVVALAILITATMDYFGYSEFSALPLLALIILFWVLTRHSWADWGLRWGRPADYGLAVLYPIFVMGILSLILVLTGANLEGVDWGGAMQNFAMIAGATIIGAFLTEEGFFRGSLFVGFKNGNVPLKKTVIYVSLIFAAWHISWATISTEGQLPLGEFPVYLINATLLGLAWGLMRALSGSVLVASLSHGVWNGMAYSFFGLGGGTGFLNISDPVIYDPERGFIGIILNAAFVVYLWRKLPQDG